jgi:predicted dehydrogenase
MINVGIIGYGYWGPNLVRNFFSNNKCNVLKVADKNPKRLEVLKKFYPSIEAVSDAYDIINDNNIDAVVIATPVSSHYELAKASLLNNKHVLVEKPFTLNLKEAEELVSISEKNKRVLMIDHVFVYNPAVIRMKELIKNGDIGDLRYYDAVRINLGLFQQDVNVLWDLAVHDISILLYIYEKKPLSLSATGVSHLKNSLENIAYITLFYDNDFIAHINVSWVSPVKIRRIIVGGSSKMLIYDDIEPTEKIKIYDAGYYIKDIVKEEERYRILIDYRLGDIYVPKVQQVEALSNVVEDFLDSIIKNKLPISNGYFGLEVMNILEKANLSIKERGKELKL